MNKEDKKLVFNKIIVSTQKLQEKINLFQTHIQWGLEKGKPCYLDEMAGICDVLAGAIDQYSDEEFTLTDMQDYK
jgi:hypothetical protein